MTSTGVWMITCMLNSPGLLTVFQLIWTLLSCWQSIPFSFSIWVFLIVPWDTNIIDTFTFYSLNEGVISIENMIIGFGLFKVIHWSKWVRTLVSLFTFTIRKNTLRKCMNLLIKPGINEIASLSLFSKYGFSIK